MIISIIIFIIVLLVAVIALYSTYFLYGMFKTKCNQHKKTNRNFSFLREWMNRKIDNNNFIADIIKEKGYGTVAIYGYGFLGELLYKELVSAGVNVNYIIDNSKKTGNIPIYSLKDNLPETDMIIVAVTYDYKAIDEKLSTKVKADIVFLEELIFN